MTNGLTKMPTNSIKILNYAVALAGLLNALPMLSDRVVGTAISMFAGVGAVAARKRWTT